MPIYSLCALGTDNLTNKSYNVKVSINGSLVAMEVDTAADYSIMSKSTYPQKFSNFPLHPSNVELKTYTGETLTVCGEMQCDIVYKGQKYTLPIIVANDENKPTLLGRNWRNRKACMGCNIKSKKIWIGRCQKSTS